MRSQDDHGLISASGSMMAGKAGEMIDLNRNITTNTPEARPRHGITGLLVTAGTALIGVLFVALGLTNLGWSVTTTPQTTQTVTAETSSEQAAVSATATTTATGDTAATSAAGDDDASVVVLTDVSTVAADVVDSVVTVQSIREFRGSEIIIGTGSGVIIDTDGTIVTNAHVVAAADSIVVVLANGTEYSGTILEVDVEEDLAAIDIDASGLNPVELGTSDGIAVGDGVIAVGYPLGLEGAPSVSTGIISALDRTLDEGDVSLTDVIQTDAAITEGSSGGALFDSSGRLIGITTAVGVSSVGIEGIGFAIPVESIVDSLSTLDGI
ncbi:MAG TPA: trypsin-like peptidase domain-containing protein [Acidimicrobiia bacterium]|nr:trypsin-like peptidase domain-containing protein [Acidimicrobiia bacterium]